MLVKMPGNNKLKTVRLKRDGYYGKIPLGAKLVTRPSRWGNPFNLKEFSLKESLEFYREWLKAKIRVNSKFLDPLKGKNLVCYCDLNKPCHADILLEFLTNADKR